MKILNYIPYMLLIAIGVSSLISVFFSKNFTSNQSDIFSKLNALLLFLLIVTTILKYRLNE